MDRLTRRHFNQALAAGAVLGKIASPLSAQESRPQPVAATQGTNAPNILFVMTDQQRFDTIAALGNDVTYTPNLDRLVHRGISFTQAYSSCPVCVAARYNIRTGCEPPTTRCLTNGHAPPAPGQASTIEERCGPYLAKVMTRLGYRTFGIGKFHTKPVNENLGYQVHLHAEEMSYSDAYATWIARKHPEFRFIENYKGERTEMYYMPQRSPLPSELNPEAWVADRAVEQIKSTDERPYFGFISFIAPHPPLAPPTPFNRIYNPDRMPNPVRGQPQVDHMDEQIPWMNYGVWAEDVNDSHARALKARYYGEITFVDDCIGRVLDAVEARGDADNTLICFYADHGDHLGDHNAWQKESFFESSNHVPFLVSWPARLPAGVHRDDLVCLTDLFGIATTAAGHGELRQGMDVLGMIDGKVKPRENLFGYYGLPGSIRFKIMVRQGNWKYIYLANGGREQLFDLKDDPHELKNLAPTNREVALRLRQAGVAACRQPGAVEALTGDDFKAFPFLARKLSRVYQFDAPTSSGRFPLRPEDAIRAYRGKVVHKAADRDVGDEE